ncbi:MAG: hypothetical protein Q4C08_03245 [Pseudomonadota bacterium]|nr:hypothetical protein [Pseudomonadota bacterium]
MCIIINGAISIDTINIEPNNQIKNTSVLVEYILYSDVPNVAMRLSRVGTSM